MKLHTLFLLSSILVATASDDVSFKVNDKYPLAVDCTIDDVKAGSSMTIAWSRTARRRFCAALRCDGSDAHYCVVLLLQLSDRTAKD